MVPGSHPSRITERIPSTTCGRVRARPRAPHETPKREITSSAAPRGSPTATNFWPDPDRTRPRACCASKPVGLLYHRGRATRTLLTTCV